MANSINGLEKTVSSGKQQKDWNEKETAPYRAIPSKIVDFSSPARAFPNLVTEVAASIYPEKVIEAVGYALVGRIAVHPDQISSVRQIGQRS